MNILLTIFLYIIVAHWIIVSTFVLIGMVGFLLYKPTKKGEEYKDTEIVIVSKASKSVEGVLFETINHTATLFNSYILNVVIDEGSELSESIKSYIANFKNVELIIVPKSYTCIAIAKGRAIEYFIQSHVNPEKWYTFIDDDNLITDRTFLREITWYSQNGYGVGNGMIKARPGRSKISFIADELRYFEDITIVRFCTGVLRTPINGFHGEILMARGDILKTVGFDRKTVTEDFSFGIQLVKRKIKVWQSETIVSVQSPHSITDFIKQRNRWYRGISTDISSAPLHMRLFFGLRVLDWRLSIIGSWLTFPIWFLFPIPMYISIFCTIGLVYYYTSYVRGAMRLRETYYLFAIPLFGIMETFSPHLRVKNKMDFNVIEK